MTPFQQRDLQPLLRQVQLELPEGQNPKDASQPVVLMEPEEADLHGELGLDRVILAYSLSCVNKYQQYLFLGKSAYSVTAAILYL